MGNLLIPFPSLILFNNVFWNEKNKKQKWGTILLKMKHLKTKQIQKSLTRFFFFCGPLIFILQQEVLTLNDICACRSSPKIDPETSI